MKYLIVSISKIKSLNTFESKRLSPVKTIAGDWVLCADILTDGLTWGFAFDYLNTCPQIEITMDDFSKPEIPK